MKSNSIVIPKLYFNRFISFHSSIFVAMFVLIRKKGREKFIFECRLFSLNFKTVFYKIHLIWFFSVSIVYKVPMKSFSAKIQFWYRLFQNWILKVPFRIISYKDLTSIMLGALIVSKFFNSLFTKIHICNQILLWYQNCIFTDSFLFYFFMEKKFRCQRKIHFWMCFSPLTSKLYFIRFICKRLYSWTLTQRHLLWLAIIQSELVTVYSSNHNQQLNWSNPI